VAKTEKRWSLWQDHNECSVTLVPEGAEHYGDKENNKQVLNFSTEAENDDDHFRQAIAKKDKFMGWDE
jgi:hypothetical protein